jgi:hypothetical protein
MTNRAASVPAHLQHAVNSYTVAYPAHEPRESDPHYRDFEAYRRRTKATAKCEFGTGLGGDYSLCSGGLELHHAHIEFALQNGVDLVLLEVRYPGVSDPDQVGAWTESADNLVWLCEKHHRSHGGVHHASASDWEAEHFVRNLIA